MDKKQKMLLPKKFMKKFADRILECIIKWITKKSPKEYKEMYEVKTEKCIEEYTKKMYNNSTKWIF